MYVAQHSVVADNAALRITRLYDSSFWAPTQITLRKCLWQSSRRKMQHPLQRRSSPTYASLAVYIVALPAYLCVLDRNTGTGSQEPPPPIALRVFGS